MCYEIREHIHAYLFATNLRLVGANPIAWDFYLEKRILGESSEKAIQRIVTATQSVDLKESDHSSVDQGFFFQYAANVRESELQRYNALVGGNNR